MIYLTAQHVVSSPKQKVGINAFFYRSTSALPRGSSGVVDLRAVLASPRGELANDDVEVKPGGNRVRSYLDIVASDAGDTTEIEDTISVVKAAVLDQSPPTIVETDVVGMQFGCERDLDAAGELDQLVERALRLLRSGKPAPWRSLRPLIILVRVEQDSVDVSLDEESIERLRTSGAEERPSKIRMSYPVLEDPKAAIGASWLHLAMLLTGLDEDCLLPLGGVRFQYQDGELLHEWPHRQ